MLRAAFPCCVCSKPCGLVRPLARGGAACRPRSALALLVAQVLADHHDPTVAADHLALVTDLLDARLNLHVAFAVSSMRVWCLAVAEDDAATGQVVGAELHHHTVLGEDPDVVLAHLPADVSENLVPVVQLHPEEGIRE